MRCKPERLRRLLILTVSTFSPSSPGVWTEWKRLLLRPCSTRPRALRSGKTARTSARSWRVSEARTGARRKRSVARAYASASRCLLARRASSGRFQRAPGPPPRRLVDPFQRCRGLRSAQQCTRVPSSRPTARGYSIALLRARAAGANIIDARVHTTRDGMALDNLLLSQRAGLYRPAPARAVDPLGLDGARREQPLRLPPRGDGHVRRVPHRPLC